MSTAILPEGKTEYLINNLDRAISEGWIEIYTQPVVRSSNGKVSEEETLARWDDPVLGVLNPSEFVPVLEAADKIESLDLYILQKVLEKMHKQREMGMDLVRNSINFSLLNFQQEDIIDKIDDLVTSFDIPKDRIAFEISESSVLTENAKTHPQLECLHKLGYRFELDDFCYNSIALLLSGKIRFDTVKLDMALTRQIPDNPIAQTVLSELTKMSSKLGLDTIVKGVETKAQADFLSEIGCAKLQGYYFSRPVSVASLFELSANKQNFLLLERTEEEPYYNAVDRMSIHELSITDVNSEVLGNFHNTIPIAIIEVDGDELTILRSNKDFMRFLRDDFHFDSSKSTMSIKNHENKPGIYALNSIKQCISIDAPMVIDDRTPTGKTAHIMLQKIAHNPVSDKNAVLIAIISIEESNAITDSLSFNYIVRALSADYVAMFFVDIRTNNYVEYHSDGANRDVTVEKRGDDFFYDAGNDVSKRTFHEDRQMFKEICTKENILRTIDEQGSFSITYRLEDKFGIRYVNLKAVRDRSNSNHLIIGVNSVDDQMKQQEAFLAIQKEKVSYSRMAALAGNIYAVYTVNIDNDSYSVYKTGEGESYISFKEKEEDFFNDTRRRIKDLIYEEDLEGFLKVINKETIIKKISDDGVFEYTYRLLVDNKPTYFMFKAVIISENGEPKLIVGIVNIDAQKRRDEKYAETLSAVENIALKDSLTGVKNKHAYALAEEEFSSQIASGEALEYAIVVFDLNNLKFVNDTYGHKKGDEFIKEGCNIICKTFAHSPVYRIGGDEFVAIAKGKDYEKLDFLMGVIDMKNNENKISGKVTIAAGTARSSKGLSFNDVFNQADTCMYEKKKKMKQL